MKIKQGQLIQGTKIRFGVKIDMNVGHGPETRKVYYSGVVVDNQSKSDYEEDQVLVRIVEVNRAHCPQRNINKREIVFEEYKFVDAYAKNNPLVLVESSDIIRIFSRGKEQSLSTRKLISRCRECDYEKLISFIGDGRKGKLVKQCLHYLIYKLQIENEYLDTRRVIEFTQNFLKDNPSISFNKRIKNSLGQNQNRFYYSRKRCIVVSESPPPSLDKETIKKVFSEKINKTNPWAGTHVYTWVAPDLSKLNSI